MVQKIGHMQVRHVLIVTLTVSEVMHTRIMAVLIDRVQIVEKDTIRHQDRIPLVNNVLINRVILKPTIKIEGTQAQTVNGTVKQVTQR